MPCNAWNHGSRCECGWGGVNHGGGGRRGVGATWIAGRLKLPNLPSVSSDLWSTRATDEHSLLVPNAHCPVCGDEVFFYRSPYGGAVYFDDVPWPWPKHPCTDRSSSRGFSFGSSFLPKLLKTATPRRPAGGWEPARFVSAHRHSLGSAIKYVYSFVRLGSGDGVSLVVDCLGGIDPRAPIFLREVEGRTGTFELTTVTNGTSDRIGSPLTLKCPVATYGPMGLTFAFSEQLLTEPITPELACEVAWDVSFNVVRYGKPGLMPSWSVARQLFEIAARAGCDDAFRGLGQLYWKGHGVEADHRRAGAFLRRAVRSGAELAVGDLQRFRDERRTKE